MTNIYVSPLASPSFECLSGAAEPPPNEFLKTGEDKQESQNLDENANEVLETVRKTTGILKGHEFETPSGTITTISVSPSSIPERSPVYCFHSFTYGVNGSNENVAELKDGEKAAAELDETAVSDSEDESFDADSPNVWRTRTVVDPDDSASPTILCKWNVGESEECLSNASGSMSLKEASLTEPSKANQSESNLQNSEAVNANSNIGKGTTLPTTKGTENSTDGTCDNAEKAPIRRLSPEGAECNAVDAQMTDAAGDTSGYLTVPGKKVVRTQRRDFVGSPSGRLDVKNYWLSDDVVEAREIVDADVQDHIPLIGQRKSHTWYTAEQGLEEVEEGAPATCFPCRGCVIL